MADLTRDRILDAAERLFAEHGVAATSLRAVMKEAGANVAAVHYHFGSRAALLEALVARRAGPVNRRRIEMLDALEKSQPDGPLPAEGVVRAFCEPALEMTEDPARLHGSRLIGRIAMEAGSAEAMGRIPGDTGRRFVSALGRAAPHLTEEEARVRLHLIAGMLVFTLIVPPDQGAGAASVREQLIRFAASGLAAPE